MKESTFSVYDRQMNKYRITNAILASLIVMVLALIFYTNTVGFCSHMNADLASDTILAKVMSDRGEWIPSTWYIANEVRLFCTPNLASLIYGITGNLQLSTGLACFTMTLLVMFSTFVFLRRLNFRLNQMLVFLLLSLVLANHFTILELQYLWASYYSCHIVLMFLTLAVYYDLILDKMSKVTIGLGVFTLIGSFSMGLQSERGLLILSIPLLGTEIIRAFSDILKMHKVTKWRVSVYVCLLVILGYLGTLLPLSISVNASRNVRHGFSKLLFSVIPDMLHSLGFYDANLCGKVLLGIFCFIAIVQMVWHVYRLLRWTFLKVVVDDEGSKQLIPNGKTWILCFFTVSPIVSMLAASFTTTESSERYYFVFLYLMAFAVILTMDEIPFIHVDGDGSTTSYLRVGRMDAFILSVLITIVNVWAVYVPIITGSNGQDSDVAKIADYLVENNYTNGYATFEYATPITVFSQGEAWISPVATVERMNICKWMTCTDWFVPNAPVDMETVYVIKDSELEEFQSFLNNSQYPCELVSVIGRFSIYSSPKNGSCLDD